MALKAVRPGPAAADPPGFDHTFGGQVRVCVRDAVSTTPTTTVLVPVVTVQAGSALMSAPQFPRLPPITWPVFPQPHKSPKSGSWGWCPRAGCSSAPRTPPRSCPTGAQRGGHVASHAQLADGASTDWPGARPVGLRIGCDLRVHFCVARRTLLGSPGYGFQLVRGERGPRGLERDRARSRAQRPDQRHGCLPFRLLGRGTVPLGQSPRSPGTQIGDCVNRARGDGQSRNWGARRCTSGSTGSKSSRRTPRTRLPGQRAQRRPARSARHAGRGRSSSSAAAART